MFSVSSQVSHKTDSQLHLFSSLLCTSANTTHHLANTTYRSDDPIGGIHHYQNEQEAIYDEMCFSQSKGKYF
jgi:hypothetical protein